jgi:cytochrome c biogenesis protein CcmG/thiol:disulfide interchange protein DsbE
MWLLLGTIVAAGILLTTLAVGFTRDPGLVSSPLIGRPAPAFSLTALTGQTLDLGSLRGRPVVLNFWASWCLPCRDEAPLLTAAAADYQARALQVLGIVYQDSAENARAFMARYGQTYPGLLDPDGRTALDYGVFGIPETFFIDRGGLIVSKQTGPLDAASLQRQIEAIVR